MQGTHIAAGITALLLIALTFLRMATTREQGAGKFPAYGWLVVAGYLVGLGLTFVLGQ